MTNPDFLTLCARYAALATANHAASRRAHPNLHRGVQIRRRFLAALGYRNG